MKDLPIVRGEQQDGDGCKVLDVNGSGDVIGVRFIMVLYQVFGGSEEYFVHEQSNK